MPPGPACFQASVRTKGINPVELVPKPSRPADTILDFHDYVDNLGAPNLTRVRTSVHTQQCFWGTHSPKRWGSPAVWETSSERSRMWALVPYSANWARKAWAARKSQAPPRELICFSQRVERELEKRKQPDSRLLPIFRGSSLHCVPCRINMVQIGGLLLGEASRKVPTEQRKMGSQVPSPMSLLKKVSKKI